MNEKQSASFLTDALIISLSNLLVKIIGVVFRKSLADILQGGIGVYTAAYSVYAMLYMVSTSGLPVAISRMVAASRKLGRNIEIKRIYRLSLIIFGGLGLVFTLAMFFGADFVAVRTEHADSALAMRVISPTLLLICLSSAFRGYFQGLRNMVPTAVSQFIEAFTKLALGLSAAYFAKQAGYSLVVQAAFAISGITVGTFLSLVFLFLYKLARGKNHLGFTSADTESYGHISKNLARVAIPVTITSSALYLSQFLDTLVINKYLISSGVAREIAEDLYSAYTGLTLSISDLLPATLIFPIAISILPAVSAALAVNNKKQADNYIHSSIRITALLALPGAFGMLAVARPAITLIYGVGFGSADTLSRVWNGKPYIPVDIASTALMILSVGIIFVSLLSTTNALLQAIGRQRLPMISISIGVAVLFVLEISLVSIPKIGIYGAPIASVACYASALTVNMLFLKRSGSLGKSLSNLFFKPLVCGAACGAGAYGMAALSRVFLGGESRLNSLITLCLAGGAGVVIYAAGLLLTRGITASEVRLLPKGNAISGFLIKKGLLDNDMT
ncbi:MAG: polysaccharide biosynthesis protein [Eubacteriales bacterium]